MQQATAHQLQEVVRAQLQQYEFQLQSPPNSAAPTPAKPAAAAATANAAAPPSLAVARGDADVLRVGTLMVMAGPQGAQIKCLPVHEMLRELPAAAACMRAWLVLHAKRLLRFTPLRLDGTRHPAGGVSRQGIPAGQAGTHGNACASQAPVR